MSLHFNLDKVVCLVKTLNFSLASHVISKTFTMDKATQTMKEEDTLVSDVSDIALSESSSTEGGVWEDFNECIVSAVEWGDIDDVKALLRDGADVNSVDKSETPLLMIAINNYFMRGFNNRPGMELISLLLSADADVELDDVDETPLMRAAEKGYPDILQALICAGARIDRMSFSGSALHFASEYGQLPCIKILLKAGADPLLRNWSENKRAKEIIFHAADSEVRHNVNLKRHIYKVLDSAEKAYNNIYLGPKGLQFACKSLINFLTKRDKLQKLPLPPTLVKFLQSEEGVSLI